MQIDEKDFIRYLTIRKKLAPRSIKTYLIRLRVIKRWLEESREELTTKTVELFLFEKKEEELVNSTLNTFIQTLRHMDGYCKLNGLSFGFAEGLEGLPKTHPEIIILSVDELERLQKTHRNFKNRNGVDCSDLDRRYLALIIFLIITGCRFNEAATLQVKRLDISNGRATLADTKNRMNRFIFFEGPIKEELAYMIQGKSPDDLVFTNSRGKHFYPGDFNDELKIRADLAGIKKRVYAHLLRHSFATHLLMAGVDISMVSTLLGHKDIQTTYETYVHLADDTLQRAAMKHPLLIQHVDPREIIKSAKESIESFHLERDSRFDFHISENGRGLSVEISLRQ